VHEIKCGEATKISNILKIHTIMRDYKAHEPSLKQLDSIGIFLKIIKEKTPQILTNLLPVAKKGDLG
jgi:hypothetical protein